ncbi:MAG TPA: hypothetical protein VNZ52_16185, partial [Candidatus Thermoplasmatota archaeon]|nr:hypothetical protein [Candidatus Thermoplasmatota archaeon]
MPPFTPSERTRRLLKVAGPVALLAGLAALAWGLQALLDIVPELPAPDSAAEPVTAELPVGAIGALVGGMVLLGLGSMALNLAFRQSAPLATPAAPTCPNCRGTLGPASKFCP